MTSVIRREKRVAIRARPKIDVLLSVCSLTPSYRYSPPKRDRTGANHDRLNIIISLAKALKNGESPLKYWCWWRTKISDHLVKRASLEVKEIKEIED